MQQQAQSMYDNIDARIRYFSEPAHEKLLPDQAAQQPHDPPLRTLVIDLEKTLVYSTYSRATGWRVAKRPGAEAFLAYMATFYEVVVFTSNLISYADPILDRLDPTGSVSYRLYRAETHYKNGVHIKDISHLNRDLRNVVVIDHDEKHVSMQPENAILVPMWTGDPSDTALLDLIPLLEGIVREDIRDVREVTELLRGRGLAEGVAEYRAMAAARADRARSASVFGNIGDDSTGGLGGRQYTAVRSSEGGDGTAADGGMGEDGDGGDGGKGAGGVWNALPGRSSLFHARSVKVKDATKKSDAVGPQSSSGDSERKV